MILGKYINKYYVRYAPLLILGLCALIAVDYFQLKIPELYGNVINGINNGFVVVDGVSVPFDANYLWNEICSPLFVVIVIIVLGRFTWRICFFIPGVKVEQGLRDRMFNHCKTLPVQFYQRNKVGNLMSLFTNDLDTLQECFGWGVMMACDALFLGGMSMYKMFQMDWKLTLFSLIPMVLMLAIGIIVGKYITMKWDARQQAFSDLSDFAQESFSGIAVIKAFVKEFKELLAFRWLNKKNEKANVAYTKISTLLNICVTLFVESVICVILGYGGYLVYLQKICFGQPSGFVTPFITLFCVIILIIHLPPLPTPSHTTLHHSICSSEPR